MSEYSLIEIVAKLTHSLTRHEEKLIEDKDFAHLTMRQIVYLDEIARLKAPTFSELALHLGISKPSITTQIEKLCSKGFLKKVQSEQDKRVFHIYLTEKGELITAKHHKVHEHLGEHFTKNLNEAEEKQLVALLSKVVRTF